MLAKIRKSTPKEVDFPRKKVDIRSYFTRGRIENSKLRS